METNQEILKQYDEMKLYDEILSKIYKDSTFCDYWQRIPRGVDFKSLELYFVDFILEHYENNELFIRLMYEMNHDGLNSYENHKLFIRKTDNFNVNEMNPDDLNP